MKISTRPRAPRAKGIEIRCSQCEEMTILLTPHHTERGAAAMVEMLSMEEILSRCCERPIRLRLLGYSLDFDTSDTEPG